MHERNLVVSLNRPLAADAAIGAKASGLATLACAGLPVPQAFCVSARAYATHLAGNGLPVQLDSLTQQLRNATGSTADTLLAEFRRAIEQAPMDEPLAEEIAHEYDALGAPAVAVRSSATAEDLPGHSFAGQYDTFLGITSPLECIQAIKQCWASLWTLRAFDYREKHGFAHRDAHMAVIVQAMVDAEASGVLFTADPATGRRDRVVIEACFGLGEMLVSGKVSPDRFVVSKARARVLDHITGEKHIELRLKTGGGTVSREVSETRGASACLDTSAAVQLAKLGTRCEALYGVPLDIEWAFANGKPYLLQARPITALPAPPSWEDRQVWTNANTGEVVPDVVTPLTWSFLQVLLDALFTSIMRWVGVEFRNLPIAGLVGGRVYFNVNTMVALIHFLPGMRNQDIGKILGGAQKGMASFSALEIPEEDIPKLQFSRWKVLLKTPVFAISMLSRSGSKAAALIDRMEKGVAALRTRDLSTLPEPALTAQLDEDLGALRMFADSLALSGTGMFWFTYLDRLCKQWFGAEGDTYANLLLAGTGGMDSAEAGLDLWRLAEQGHAHPEVAELLLSPGPWQSVSKALQDTPEGRTFLASWRAFMGKHGHHTRGELEVCNPRWSETPDYILETVRVYLRAQGRFDAMDKYRQRARESEALTAQCRQRLKNPAKRMIFNLVLNRAKQGSLIRENIKSGVMRYWAGFRATVLEIGQRLAARGVLDRRDDVFFLSLDEVRQLTNGTDIADFKETIAARKTEYERNQAVNPPGVVIGRWDPSKATSDSPQSPTDLFHGIPVSPGVVTGPARVILRANTEEQVQPGEILVAPFTDPGWTPYFMTAAAIVMDQGGILSHGSIVAREYGIPAVVNVGPATKSIQTGQLLEVDGTRGTVKRLTS